MKLGHSIPSHQQPALPFLKGRHEYPIGHIPPYPTATPQTDSTPASEPTPVKIQWQSRLQLAFLYVKNHLMMSIQILKWLSCLA